MDLRTLRMHMHAARQAGSRLHAYVGVVTSVNPRLRLIGHHPSSSVAGPHEKSQLQDLAIEREMSHVEPLAEGCVKLDCHFD